MLILEIAGGILLALFAVIVLVAVANAVAENQPRRREPKHWWENNT